MKNLEIFRTWNKLNPSPQAAERMDDRFYAALNAELELLDPVLEENKNVDKKSWLKFLTSAAVILLALGLVIPIYKLWQDRQFATPGIEMHKSRSLEDDNDTNPESGPPMMAAPPSEEANDQTSLEDQVEAALLDDISDEKELAQAQFPIDTWTPDPQLEPYNLKGIIQRTSKEPEKAANEMMIFADIGGLLYKDISEMNTLNLYEEGNRPTHLPVVVNPFYEEGADSFMSQRILTLQELEAIIEEIADKHGVTILETDLDREDRFPETEGQWLAGNEPVTVVGDPYNIFFDPIAMQYDLYFKEPIKLDFEDSYKFSPELLAEHSYEELRSISLAATEKIMMDFQDLLGLEYPVVVEDYNAYDANGQRMFWQPYIVELAGTDASEQVVNANFKQVHLIDWPFVDPDDYGISYQELEENNYLFGFRFNYVDPSNIVGDYPLASLEEALSALEEGYYHNLGHTPDLYRPLANDVERVELGYYLHNESGDFVPYYIFYIVSDNEQAHGLKEYFAYYVPAIAPSYLQVDGEAVDYKPIEVDPISYKNDTRLNPLRDYRAPTYLAKQDGSSNLKLRKISGEEF